MQRLLRHYWPELLITVAVWALVGWQLGVAALVVTIILSALEITLSADNAVVNSRVLVKMSPLWQRLFLTVGIIIAVFGVRFVLPVLLVAIGTPLGAFEVLSLALDNPDEYGRMLHDIAPLIDGFGGMFLFMVALFFFMEPHRKHVWIKPIENALRHIGKHKSAALIVTAVLFAAVEVLLPANERLIVGVAMAAAIGVYTLLHSITLFMSKMHAKNETKKQVGWVAFISFLYLEVLDASFSLDGVVGAFALTNNIIIIMAGLGVGAIWVRTMTIYMVRNHTLFKYKYLESGAHWAIVSLSIIMFLKLFSIELPEIFIGTIGLVFISASVISSIKENKLHNMSDNNGPM